MHIRMATGNRIAAMISTVWSDPCNHQQRLQKTDALEHANGDPFSQQCAGAYWIEVQLSLLKGLSGAFMAKQCMARSECT